MILAKRLASRESRLLDLVSIAVLVAAVCITFVRFAPARARFQAKNVCLLSTGDVRGCGIEAAWNPLDADLYDNGLELRGQIERRQADGLLGLWDTPFGAIWSPFGNDLLILLAEYAVDVYEVGSQPFSEGAVVMDCGANIGTFSRQAFNAGAATVIAVEPSPLNVEALRRNFAAEIESGKFILIDTAVWNEPGEMELNVYELSVLDSLVMEERHEAPMKSKVPVELTTIDSIVEKLDLERLDFIKMDVEGAERQALSGAARTLRRFRLAMSIATENLLDDIDVVPAKILATVADYKMTEGRCINTRPGVLRPEIVRFDPLPQPALGTD